MDDKGRLIIPGSKFIGKTFEELGTLKEVQAKKPQPTYSEDGPNRKERRAERAQRRKELSRG